MNYKISLLGIKPLEKIPDYWSNQDYKNLLEIFEYPDFDSTPDNELFQMLSLAVSDYEPEEAAERVLEYKLGDVLKDGQIDNISHEMLDDKVSEEYPDIGLHYPLFNINRLLYELYNGKFPKSLASQIDIVLKFEEEVEITKELIIRSLAPLLAPNSLIKRLYNDQLSAEKEMEDAGKILWTISPLSGNTFRLITSEYWLNDEDFAEESFVGAIKMEIDPIV